LTDSRGSVFSSGLAQMLELEIGGRPASGRRSRGGRTIKTKLLITPLSRRWSLPPFFDATVLQLRG
jgi:hypothetical protein